VPLLRLPRDQRLYRGQAGLRLAATACRVGCSLFPVRSLPFLPSLLVWLEVAAGGWDELGCRGGGPGNCTVGSSAGDVAVVVALLLGHGDGVEWAAGFPGVGAASAVAAPRPCLGGFVWCRRAALGSVGVVGVDFGRKPSAFAPTVTAPVGVVSLLGAPLWSLPHARAPGENL
jgi:hypothetical protein